MIFINLFYYFFCKVALLSAPKVDFQWLSDRTSIIFSAAGFRDMRETTTLGPTVFDPWIECMSIFMSQEYVVGKCQTAISSTWPLLFNRLKVLYIHVDPK